MRHVAIGGVSVSVEGVRMNIVSTICCLNRSRYAGPTRKARLLRDDKLCRHTTICG